jgi:hypothetical protein
MLGRDFEFKSWLLHVEIIGCPSSLDYMAHCSQFGMTWAGQLNTGLTLWLRNVIVCSWYEG